LRESLVAAGIIGFGSDPPMRLVTATCAHCGETQHHVIGQYETPKCIVCGRALEGAS
jgi:hypothetical protein